jgi:hypothetical protein
MLKCGDWGVGGGNNCEIYTNEPTRVRKISAMCYITEIILKLTLGLDVLHDSFH